VAPNCHGEAFQELAADRPYRHSRRRFPRTGTLDDVAYISLTVLERTSQVGMAGPETRHWLGRREWRLRIHLVPPIRPVAIFNAQRDRRAECVTMADSREHVNGISLDLHAAATPIATLPATQLFIYCIFAYRYTGWHSLNDGREAWAVRLAGGYEAEHEFSLPLSSSTNTKATRPADSARMGWNRSIAKLYRSPS
jgi:hypothetical protein